MGRRGHEGGCARGGDDGELLRQVPQRERIPHLNGMLVRERKQRVDVAGRRHTGRHMLRTARRGHCLAPGADLRRGRLAELVLGARAERPDVGRCRGALRARRRGQDAGPQRPRRQDLRPRGVAELVVEHRPGDVVHVGGRGQPRGPARGGELVRCSRPEGSCLRLGSAEKLGGDGREQGAHVGGQGRCALDCHAGGHALRQGRPRCARLRPRDVVEPRTGTRQCETHGEGCGGRAARHRRGQSAHGARGPQSPGVCPSSCAELRRLYLKRRRRQLKAAAMVSVYELS
mmetsp:Transcript_1165/g.3054  ORF Transcript_1165/g.3054 Transcript_1165/m.3054 type:complete len:288 (+) Transcript_1165:688-1551(+)